jgi:hypothetical protein
VVLVEDESQQEFLRAIASVLEHDIDEKSISVIEVGGHNGYGPYRILLDRLGIPYVALRDKGWGDNPSYPPKRYFSLGCELEAYFEKHGLAEIRYEIEKEVGRSKRRVAGVLGSRLTLEQIPSIFNEVLKAAMNLSTGLTLPPVEVG